MRIKNNIEFDIDQIQKTLEEKTRKLEDDGLVVYGIRIHPQTLRDLLTSDEYSKQYGLAAHNRLFFYKTIPDIEMYQNEMEVLVSFG